MTIKQGINREQIKKLLKIDYMIDNYLGIFKKNKVVAKPQFKQTYTIESTQFPQTNYPTINIKRRPPSAKPSERQNSQSTYEVSNHKIPITKNKHQLILKSSYHQTLPQNSKMNTTESNLNLENEVIQTKNITSRAISCQKINKKEKNIIKNRYEIISIIGKGMSGSVYKANDILSDRFVAIKIVPIESKEYHYMKELDHENIVKYYNSFIQKNKRYLILQFFPLTLQTLLRKRKLDENQVKYIFLEIINAVVYLHSICLAHRDIKLDNIVISQDLKTIKFIDFGLCIDTNQQFQKLNEQSEDFCGTANYLPPQIVKRKKYDPKKADIWSLGVLLYTLTFGRYPFQGRDQNDTYLKIQTKKLILPSTIPQFQRQLISDMLNKNPQKRPNILDVLSNEWLKSE